MSLVSLEFLAFFLLAALIYFIMPEKLQWAWLLIASGFFYYKNTAWYQALILLGFLFINYIISLIIGRLSDKRKPVYVGVLIFDIVFLLALKYFSFFIPIFQKFGISENALNTARTYLTELAPFGISYIALIVIGYMTDLYWENVKLQKNPGKFMLFACYFPQTVSGPLVKYSEYDDNLWGEKHKFDYDRIVRGTERVLWGVFKKLVISARAATVANQIHDNYKVYMGFYIPVGILFFIIQLYTDFSGLMDIVIGISEILGIKMPENFNTPLYSETMSEFWRRWHITLGRFLRDYVLFPMQMSGWFRKLRKAYKKRFGKDIEKKLNIPRYLTMLVSWIIIGFWHSGGWNYIIGTGIYMWVVIILGEILAPAFKKLTDILRINTECFSWHMFRRVRTLVLYMFGVSFFWAEDLKTGFGLWRSAFSKFNPWIFFDKSLYRLGLDKDEMVILAIGVALLFIVSHINYKNPQEQIRDKINRQNFVFRLALFTVLFVMTVVYGHYGSGFDAANFIYGRF